LVRGDYFEVLSDENPFLGPELITYTVIETKEGWVKYKINYFVNCERVEKIKYCKEEEFNNLIKYKR